jgi:hypothetical protein
VQSFPFSAPPASLLDKDSTRRKLAQGHLPWDISPDQEREPISSIVRDCWNGNPILRPSATFIAQGVLDILVRKLVGAPPALFIPHDVLLAVKERVLQGISDRKSGTEQAISIDPKDVRILRKSADSSVDTVSSFLLGAAILHGLIPAHMYDHGNADEDIEPHDEGM